MLSSSNNRNLLYTRVPHAETVRENLLRDPLPATGHLLVIYNHPWFGTAPPPSCPLSSCSLFFKCVSMSIFPLFIMTPLPVHQVSIMMTTLQLGPLLKTPNLQIRSSSEVLHTRTSIQKNWSSGTQPSPLHHCLFAIPEDNLAFFK